MPNTLAHIAINIPMTKLGFKQIDLKWVLLGTIIPDIPWILQRIIISIPAIADPYALRIYLMIQASLFFTIILSFALAGFSSNPLRTFLILTFGSLIHLLSDALEIKWANGVHLFAPFDWTIINFGLFWPESIPIYTLTIIGLILYGFQFMNNNQSIRLRSPGRRSVLIILMLIIYFTAPFLFSGAVLDSNSHFVKTLSERSRAGQYFELDRAVYVNNRYADYIETFANEKLYLDNLDLAQSAAISLKARFNGDKTIHIYKYYLHEGGVRNMLSVFGVFLIFLYWTYLFLKGFRYKRAEKL